MQLVRSDAHTGLGRVVAALLLVQLVVLGIAALLFFWREILPGRGLSDHSLVLVALVAGIAATFNPCAIPALPGFVAAAGATGEEATARERLRLSAAASLGAAAVVAVFGLMVAVAGSSTGKIIEHNFRWVQLVAGIVLIALAAIHLAGQTSRLPFVRTAMGVGNRIWEGVAGQRSTASSFGWGAGFIAIGAG